MRPPSLNLRLTPLLLLAAALVALAAFLAPAAQPARAQTTTVWSATLTVQDSGTWIGCRISTPLCSSALTDDDLTYGGVDYEVNDMRVNTSGTLLVQFSKTIPASLKSFLTLNVDGTAFALADATYDTGFNTNDRVVWLNTGLSWSVGDTVQLSLTEEEYKPDLTLSALTVEKREGGSTFSALNIAPGAPGRGPAKLDQVHAFAPGTNSYRAAVLHPVTHARLTPTSSQSALITLSVNGVAVNSGSTSGAIPLSVGDNAITVRVTASTGETGTYTVTIVRLPPNTTEWSATLDGRRKIADETYGCRNRACSDPAVLSSNTFHHNRMFADGAFSTSWRIQELYIRPRGTYNGQTLHELALTTAPVNGFQNLPPGFTLIVTYRVSHSNLDGTQGFREQKRRFPISHAATETGDGRVTYLWPVDDGLAFHWGTNLQLKWDAPTTGLQTVRVHYDAGYRMANNEIWSATLATKSVLVGGGSAAGCDNQDIATVRCSTAAVLTDDDFTTADGTTFAVTFFGVNSSGRVNIVFDTAIPAGFRTLYVNDTELRLADATITNAGMGAQWSNAGLAVSAGDTVQLRLEERELGARGFGDWLIAQVSTYYASGSIAYLPAEMPNGLPTTHAKLMACAATPGSTVEVAKGTYLGPPAGSAFVSLACGDLSQAIELESTSSYTHVYVRVTDTGGRQTIHRIIIDPPPRIYSLAPEVEVTEGEEAEVTLTLGSPATTGGVTFDVTVAYGDGGATAADVGEAPATVTVPAGERSVRIRIPTLDDDEVEDLLGHEERFTVSVSHTGYPAWGEDPHATGTSVVTIVDNDEPPKGPEPWNVKIVPGDGILTVTWRMGQRPGWDDDEIRHALRWSQESGVWANPRDPRAIGRNDGIATEPGATSYVITGLKNDVPTGVYIRSFEGYRLNPAAYDPTNRNRSSSEWVWLKGEHTTPRAPQQRAPGEANNAPTVASAIADATIVNESGTQEVSLAGVFADADNDALTVTAASADEAVATVSVAADGASLTVSAQARGTATIRVTADDGHAGVVSDEFTVTVKAAPVVASAIADRSGAVAGTTRAISLSGVFDDADGDALTITAASSDEAKATVSVASDGSSLTLVAEAEGTATLTATAQDADGNRVSDSFDVSVVAAPDAEQEEVEEKDYSELIAEMYDRRNNSQWSNQKSHTDRWDRALLAFGETVADKTLTPMTAAEAQAFADRGWVIWEEVAKALREIEQAQQQQQQAPANNAPTVASAIADATIVNASGTQSVSLSGVFADADGDALTITAASSDTAKATVSVSADQTTLTVSAAARGTATVTVTANDGNGGTVEDTFTVTVKAAPTVASALADVSGLTAGDTQDVSLSGVFSDADGDSLTITAASSDPATVSVASDGSKLTLSGVAEGTATVTVTARDSDGNEVTDEFDVAVEKQYAALIARMWEWRNDPARANNAGHTNLWDRALLAFGETVADSSLTAMTAAEAQTYADRGWQRWVEVAKALKEIEGG